MIRYGLLALAIISALCFLAAGAWKYHDSVYQSGRSVGFAECNALALAAAEKKRVEDQGKIDDIRKRAETEIASRVSSNVKKALDDARKADPDCKPFVPPSALDELRKRGGPK